MTDPIWFTEDGATNVVVHYRCLRSVYSGRSRYAKIDIVDTAEYGRMLFLDGIAQSADQDEFITTKASSTQPCLAIRIQGVFALSAALKEQPSGRLLSIKMSIGL